MKSFCLSLGRENKNDILMSAKTSAYWLDIADYDLETAEAMYSTGRWLYVAFMCHQVIEKTIKAYWCATMPDEPPYTHNHKRLADGCGLYGNMDNTQHNFIDTITTFNIETRYPEDKAALSKMLTKQNCRNIIDETKKLQLWIKGKLSVKATQSNSSDNTSK